MSITSHVPLTLEVSDELVAAMHLPPEEVPAELRREMALGLYQRGVLSGGKASELAGLERLEFEQLLADRKVIRPFTVEDLEKDYLVVDELLKSWAPPSARVS